ncbi:hypothetical protein KEM60_02481 [Austwickia sp. TVS 96-490-7B]|uniref:lysophospholipid acyltransferase family protein n=1 Tax=Austwickia sp. TVS 96-490-7B TaxID=2830843 RepID=UPI001C57F907|nr:lysophospholipid acyltransferase family protein [Austwickia sp. TVS 96-490-7B]MBW3086269.1 hypothetical protein [Austwickia sp. TVS 96-490-7B]
MEPVYDSVVALTRAVFAAQGLRFRITGAHHVPREGAAVMVINHTGYMDFTYAGFAAERAGRLVRFMCKDSIFHHRVAGPLMRGMKHIPVDREAGAASFKTALKALRSGEIVGVFPEATISRSFELKEFKSGAVRMAQASGAPLLPVVIWGSQRVWTKGKPKRMGRTGTPIAVRVGEPIPVPKNADPAEINAELKRRMAEMLEIEQREYPTLTGADLQFLPARLGGTAPSLEEATALDEQEAHERRLAKGLAAAPQE